MRHASSPLDTLGNVIEETLLDAIDKMEKAVEHVQSQFTTVRTGRASPALVEKLMADYYGSMVPIQQLAGFQVPEARQLIVKPHDRASLGAIEKAIRDSDLGVSPSNDGVSSASTSPRSPKSAARNSSRSSRTWQRTAELQFATFVVMPASTSTLPRRRRRSRPMSWNEPRRRLRSITHEHVELIDKAFGRKEQELLEV